MLSNTTDQLIRDIEKNFPPGFDLSLDRISELLNRLGNPHHSLPPVIHIAGTNGKGSTAAFSRSLLESAGYSVHVHTSPHLVKWHERFRLAAPGGGRYVEEEVLLETIHSVTKANCNNYITVFELMTAVMFVLFAQYPADAAIIEVGLGGRLDATNVIESPAVSVITSISYDHEAFLGNTIQLITAEKAGIIKSGVPVTIGLQEFDSAIRTIETIAKQKKSEISLLGQDFFVSRKNERLVYRDQASLMDLSPPLLLGDHQFANAATAISAVRTAGFNISSEAADLAMRTVNWPGRMQLLPYGSLSELSPEGAEIWIDGAHNPAAGSVIAQTLHQLQKTKPLNVFMIAGMISTKDHTGYFKAFYGLVQRVYTVPVLASPQGVPPCELASYAREAGLLAKPMDSVSHALNFLREENKGEKKPIRILISGSLYLIGSLLEENGTPPV